MAGSPLSVAVPLTTGLETGQPENRQGPLWPAIRSHFDEVAAFVMGVGAVFGVMNPMYAIVASPCR